jgi:hypothetical protein
VVIPTVILPLLVGGEGPVRGIIKEEADDNNELPIIFIAITLNVYAVPFVNPVTMKETVCPLTVFNKVEFVMRDENNEFPAILETKIP